MKSCSEIDELTRPFRRADMQVDELPKILETTGCQLRSPSFSFIRSVHTYSLVVAAVTDSNLIGFL